MNLDNESSLVNNFVIQQTAILERSKIKSNTQTTLKTTIFEKLKLNNTDTKLYATKDDSHINLNFKHHYDFKLSEIKINTKKVPTKSVFVKIAETQNKNNGYPIKEKTRYEKLIHSIHHIMESKYFAIVFIIFIISELFLEDIKLMFIPKKYDIYLDITIFSIACLLIFEMAAGWMVHKEYRMSLFFVIDLLSNISLLPYFYIFLENQDKVTDEEDFGSLVSFILNNSHVSKTSKVSLAGSRLSRIYSLLKIFRFFSLGRIYKYNIDRIIKKNEEQVQNFQKKEEIKKMRRKPIILVDFEEKMNFFRDVHNALNIEEADDPEKKKQKLNRLKTAVHPKIIENFYEYAMKNEKKFEEENGINISANEDNNNNQAQSYEDTVYEMENFENKSQFKKLVNIMEETQNEIQFERESMPKNSLITNKNEDVSILSQFNNTIDPLFEIIKSPDLNRKYTNMTSKTIRTNFCTCIRSKVSKKAINEGLKITASGSRPIMSNLPDTCENCQGIIVGINLDESMNTYVSHISEEMKMNTDNNRNPGNTRTSAIIDANNTKNIGLPKQIMRERRSAWNILDKIDLTKVVTPSPTRRRKSLILETLSYMDNSEPKFFQNDEHISIAENQRLSFKLSRLITVKTVIVILLILFSDPFLTKENYLNYDSAYTFQIDLLSNYLITNKHDKMDKFINRLLNKTYQKENGLHIAEIGITNNYTREYYNISHLYFNDTIYSNYTIINLARKSELIKSSNKLFYIIYDHMYEAQIHAALNFCKIIFVCICLYMFSFYSIYDIQKYLLIPLEDLFKTMKDKKFYTESIYFEVDHVVDSQKRNYQEIYEEEIFLFEKFFRKMIQNFIRVLGIRAYNFYVPRIFGESELATNMNSFYKLKGVIMIIEISNYYELLKSYNENFTTYLSSLLTLIDLTMFENFGEIIRIDRDKILIIWDKKIAEERKRLKRDEDNPYNIFFVNQIKITKKFISLALMAAAKLLGRTYHDFTDVKLSISINKGPLNYLLINTYNRIDISVNSTALRDTIKNLRVGKKYSLPIIITKKVYLKLNNELQDYCRIVPEKDNSVYTYDISYERERYPIKDESIMKTEHAFMERKNNAIILNKMQFDMTKLIKTDVELLSLRASNSKIFVKYYQLAFKRFINKKNIDALEYLDEALKHRPNDYLCIRLKTKVEKITK